MKARAAILLLLIACCALPLNAQEPAMDPHEGGFGATGVLLGKTVTKDGDPLGDQIVTLEVFHGGQLVLTIPKKTGADGSYQFKNIFQNEEFSYAVSADYKGTRYQTHPRSLASGAPALEVDLIVGDSARAGSSWPLDVFQTIAFALSLAGVAGAFYLSRRRT